MTTLFYVPLVNHCRAPIATEALAIAAFLRSAGQPMEGAVQATWLRGPLHEEWYKKTPVTWSIWQWFNLAFRTL